MGETMNLTLKVWRQRDAASEGRFETYPARDVAPDMSFLEMLDTVNEDLERKGADPIAFDHDCREGICGCCGAVVNGRAHGPVAGSTLCQLHMRHFKDGDEIVIEPFRAKAFPLIKDLVVDRSALDRIIQAGGFISTRTGSAPEAHSVLVKKEDAEAAADAAECIGCGACAAACPNAAGILFVGAKIVHLARLPQGQPERNRRVLAMVEQMDKEGFGLCSMHRECTAICPKGISVKHIAAVNREYLWALVKKGLSPRR